ncbi:MAG: hypothetical protein ACRD12_24080 [Acidimicrobiales bacterium]
MKVYVEAGTKKVFACAVDWPGWSRAARSEELALDALAEYCERYEPVAEAAGLSLPKRTSFDVDERVRGDATTDIGAPSAWAACDRRKLTAKQGEKIGALVKAAWDTFDAVAAGAPAELRRGPRGGGRDRDKMIDHVLGAESVYLRKVGVRFKQPAIADTAAIGEARDAFLAVLRTPSDGEPPVEKGWPVRYTARRVAWHVLDHAWEMEDRS